VTCPIHARPFTERMATEPIRADMVAAERVCRRVALEIPRNFSTTRCCVVGADPSRSSSEHTAISVEPLCRSS
jgi:hypothetical protein